MSNPPSRGSGSGAPAQKTYGKHEVPSLNIEEEKSAQKDGLDENDMAAKMGEANASPSLLNKQLAKPTALVHSRSFPNAGSLLGSPASTPGGTRRSQLPPSGIKLPVPPPSLLNGLANVHKSASSASLNIAAVSPSAGRSDQLRESVTLPNAGQMLAAARSELLLNNGIGSNGGGIGLQKAAVAGAARARLPPLQLPKGPAQNGNNAVKDTEKGERLGSSSSSSQTRGGTGQQQAAAEDGREESGPIATMASEPMPQMQPLEPHQMTPMPAIISSEPTASPPPPPAQSPFPVSSSRTIPSPIPPPPMASLPPPARVPPLHSVPNEVPVHAFRRRSSSVGQLPTTKDVSMHKPLPSIAEPVGIEKTAMYGGNLLLARKRAKSWRLALKCGILSLFLSIPVVIFLLMMLFTDGFSGGSAATNSTMMPPSDGGPIVQAPLTTTPVVNIVGGAIFAPISMQNETTPVGGGGNG